MEKEISNDQRNQCSYRDNLHRQVALRADNFALGSIPLAS